MGRHDTVAWQRIIALCTIYGVDINDMHIFYVNHNCLKAGQVLCAMSLTWQESMHAKLL